MRVMSESTKQVVFLELTVPWEDWGVLSLSCVSWKRVYDFEMPKIPKDFIITDDVQMYLQKLNKPFMFKPT